MATTPLDDILVIQNDTRLADAIRRELEDAGYTVSTASSGQSGLAAFHAHPPALVIVDLALPDVSGLDVCWIMRWDSPTPIVVVSDDDEGAQGRSALAFGADELLTKPFEMPDLLSRVRANLQRTRSREPAVLRPHEEILRGGPVQLDLAAHEATVHGRPIPLPPKEFELLELFLLRQGRLIPRKVLIEEIWGPDFSGDTRTLDVHVKRLRGKIEENPRDPVHVRTVRGLGYKFVGDL